MTEVRKTSDSERKSVPNAELIGESLCRLGVLEYAITSGQHCGWEIHFLCESWVEEISAAPPTTVPDFIASAKPISKYHRPCKGVEIDVYDVLQAFKVTNPAIAHAVKKCLAPGQRGAKSWVQDVEEAIKSLTRALEMGE